MLGIVLGLLAVGLFYWSMVRPHSYWTKRGVKQGSKAPLFGDNWGTFIRKQSFSDMVQHVYRQFPNDRFSGMYQFLKPLLVIRDPELIRQIAIKDFDHFTDHVSFMPEGQEPLLSSNVFVLKGNKWRYMRATLSPAFTSSKMRAMFELMSQCAEQFTAHFLGKKEDVIDIEMKDTFTRFTNDVIANCAFGIKCDSFEQCENEFYMMGKRALDFSSFWRMMKITLYIMAPKFCKTVGITFFGTRVMEFFKGLVQDTVKLREETKLIRPDMIHLLMEARKGKLVYDEQQSASKEIGYAVVEESNVGTSTKVPKMDITLVDITAQALIFFFAGFDTVSTLMCFMAYEVAIDPDIQKRLLKEVDDTMLSCNGKLTYDALNKMKYLDMIIAETLRLWPPAASTDRVCVSPYTIKSQGPSEPTVHLQKGDWVWIPIWALHHDPEYYPNPYKFDPERFSDENKDNIKPYTYLPFGVGPRSCIGCRFALLETKTIIVHILSKFEIVVTKKTELPVKLTKSGIATNAENGFHFGLKKRCK